MGSWQPKRRRRRALRASSGRCTTRCSKTSSSSNPPYLLAYAEALALDTGRFSLELAEHVHAPKVREDFISGVRSGVNGTPTFYIHGVRHDGSWEAEPAAAAQPWRRSPAIRTRRFAPATRNSCTVVGVTQFERFFRTAAGLDVDKADLKRYSDFLNRKIYDLLIRGEAAAKANRRDVIEPFDLPITKGLRRTCTSSGN